MTGEETITLTCSATADTSVGEVVLPRILGSLRLIREIGHGGMGIVWPGHDKMLDRDVAVQFLLNAVAGSDDPRLRTFSRGGSGGGGGNWGHFC